MAARLALLRWVGRIVRREWRQHLLVTALIAFGIAAAVVAVSTTVRLSEPESSYLGSAQAVIYAARREA